MSKPHRKRLIIYDLDGTLVDTLEDIFQSANFMLTRMRVPLIAREETKRYVGRGVTELVKSCLKTQDARLLEEGLRIYRAHYGEHLLDHSRLYPDAKAVLERFKDRRQAVITNKPNPYSQRILRALGVADYFVRIIPGNSEYPKKPDPTSILALMNETQSQPEETVFVGDSAIDVETGRNAGVGTVGILHGFSEPNELVSTAPDLLVSDFRELLRVTTDVNW